MGAVMHSFAPETQGDRTGLVFYLSVSQCQLLCSLVSLANIN